MRNILIALFAIFTLTGNAYASDLTISVIAERDGRTVELEAGEPVKVDDLLTLEMKAPTTGHLYILSCSAAGEIYLLINGAAVKAGEKFANDDGFPVIGPTGDERLLVMFSPARLDIDNLLPEIKRFFSAWMDGQDVTEFAWNIQGTETATSRTRSIGTELHYQSVSSSSIIVGMLMLRSVPADTKRPMQYRCGPQNWGTRGACTD